MLENLLETLALGMGASNDPKRTACGASDFVVERGHVPLGYGETKNSGDDIAHYQSVVALKETIRLMKEIDAVIPGWSL